MGEIDGDAYILWAAMQAMVNDVHAPQDMMTPAQWERAGVLLADLDRKVNSWLVNALYPGGKP